MRRFIVTLALMLVPLTSFATVVMALSMEELTARSPLVVRGVVHRVDTQWGEYNRIWTYAEVVVHETFKGSVRTTVLVKQPGGFIEGRGQSVAGAAQFKAGEEVVLFLEPATDETNTFVPYSMAASKVTLADKGGKRLATRDLSGISFAVQGRRGLLEVRDPDELLGFADQFLSRIRLAAKGGAK